MKYIPLRGKDGHPRAYAIVDDRDYASLSHFTWRLSPEGYVRRSVERRGKQTDFLLHRDIMGLTRGDGLEVDHINGDPLDNRRDNLRITTRAQNGQNRRLNRNNTSGHRGVNFDTRAGRWRASATVAGRYHHIGHFDTQNEAAVAAREFRQEYMPFAVERAA